MSVTRIEQTETTCPECGGAIVKDTEGAYCEECGLVVEGNILNYKDKYNTPTHEKSDNDAKRGAESDTTLHHTNGLGSEIGWKKSLNGKQRKRVGRLRKQHERWQWDGKDRTFTTAATEILRLAGELDLPEAAKKQAGKILKQANEKDLAVGYSADLLGAACLFLSTRQMNIVRSLEEWQPLIQGNTKRWDKCRKTVAAELDLGYMPNQPSDYVPSLASALNLSDSDRKEVVDLVKEVEETGLHIGKHPQSVAAACIYLKTNLTQTKVSEETDLSHKTLQTRLTEIKDELNFGVNS